MGVRASGPEACSHEGGGLQCHACGECGTETLRGRCRGTCGLALTTVCRWCPRHRCHRHRGRPRPVCRQRRMRQQRRACRAAAALAGVRRRTARARSRLLAGCRHLGCPSPAAMQRRPPRCRCWRCARARPRRSLAAMRAAAAARALHPAPRRPWRRPRACLPPHAVAAGPGCAVGCLAAQAERSASAAAAAAITPPPTQHRPGAVGLSGTLYAFTIHLTQVRRAPCASWLARNRMHTCRRVPFITSGRSWHHTKTTYELWVRCMLRHGGPARLNCQLFQALAHAAAAGPVRAAASQASLLQSPALQVVVLHHWALQFWTQLL